MTAQIVGTNRPIILDLFCGAGGAAMGYHRAGFDVIGVDIEPQPHYPFDFFQGDAVEFLQYRTPGGYIGHLTDIDAIHASPPCQAYSTMQVSGRPSTTKNPDLVKPVRALLEATGLPWVMENVPGSPIRTTVELCGSAFGLGVRRHRRFETSFLVMGPPLCQHDRHEFVGVYGDHASPNGERAHPDGHSRRPRARSLAEAQEAMGMNWADWHGTKEAIPPAYTEWIGARLMEQVMAHAG